MKTWLLSRALAVSQQNRAGSVIDIAREGIGVTHVAAKSLDPAIATRMIAGADTAFVDAMTKGFWISVGFIAIGLITSLTMLPKHIRETQMARSADDLAVAHTVAHHSIPADTWAGTETDALVLDAGE